MIAEIIVEINAAETDRIFDYIVPSGMALSTGFRVLIPFGNRKIEGYVVNLKQESVLPKAKLKNIIGKLDDSPAILPEMLKLTDFMVKKYNLKKVDVLRLMLPSSLRKGTVNIKFKSIVKLANNVDLEVIKQTLRKNANKQFALINFFENNISADQVDLNKMFGSVVVNKFIESGVLTVTKTEEYRNPLNELKAEEEKDLVLTSDQQNALNKINATKSATTYVLNGVTGSGKTEVYMRAINNILAKDKTAIMLVPEISLTPQVVKNFYNKFGATIAVLHSKLSAGERYDEWRRIKEGKAKIVVGARSAIFAPIKNVGLIIIDEEHDTSYISESNPRYFTHEIAKFRSQYNNCALILGSATPSLESYKFALDGKYELLNLKIRANKKEMPHIETINMTNEVLNGNNSPFSNRLIEELTKVINKKEQAIIFINRRGFSSFLRCVECGHIPKCEDCDVSLVYHKHDNQLKCHFCGRRYHAVNKCSECGSLKIRQGGIGTQRVVEELKEAFKGVEVFRLDNDTTTTKNAHGKILSKFASTKPSILVGTQMIAKGHDFPLVTLVGILDADLSLYFSDYAATERTFQLVTQVAGRAGRDELSGKVILQTYTPKHYVYRFVSSYNYNEFYKKESNLRSVTNFPPYAKVIRVLVTGENENKTIDFLKGFYEKVNELKSKYGDQFIYLEAMKSPVKRIKNKFRYQILVRLKLEKAEEITGRIYEIHNDMRGRVVTSFIEVNPTNLS